MRQYLVRRLLLFVPVFIGVSVVIFFFTHIAPGDVAVMIAGEYASPAELARLREELGLNKPLYEQYFNWLRAAVTADMGRSFLSQRPVLDELVARIPLTFELAGLAVLLSLAIGIPLGIICAIRQDTWVDYVARVTAISGVAIPHFWLATLLITFLALWFHYSPPLEFVSLTEDVGTNLQQLMIPAFSIGVYQTALVSRMSRSMMLEVMRQDYIRTAWAKGLAERVVIFRHALKNALIPVVTVFGNEFGHLLGGAVVIEQIFGLPGVGKLTLFAITNRDYHQVEINVLFLAMVYAAVNLIVDIAYGFFDPRVAYR
ncbi:MAG: ABC transporter permease [Chloroflexi bacterium]|nr:ABC transporter permease [Chloroflexota bacterium]